MGDFSFSFKKSEKKRKNTLKKKKGEHVILWQGPYFDTKIVSQMAQSAKIETSANKAIKSRAAIVGFFWSVSSRAMLEKKMKVNFDKL